MIIRRQDGTTEEYEVGRDFDIGPITGVEFTFADMLHLQRHPRAALRWFKEHVMWRLVPQ